MLPEYDDLVEEIKNKREELDWSRKKLAEKADVSRNMVGKLERKEHVPSYKRMKRIYDELKKREGD